MTHTFWRRPGFRAAALVAASLLGLPAYAAEPSPPGATSCSGCHGAGAAFGTLAGKSADKIVKQLAAFRSGERPSTVMARIAKGFDEAETRAIAEWWAKQEPVK